MCTVLSNAHDVPAVISGVSVASRLCCSPPPPFATPSLGTPRPAAGTKHEGRKGKGKNVDANDTCRAGFVDRRALLPSMHDIAGTNGYAPMASRSWSRVVQLRVSQYLVSDICVLLYVPFFFVLSFFSPPFIRGRANTHVRSWTFSAGRVTLWLGLAVSSLEALLTARGWKVVEVRGSR